MKNTPSDSGIDGNIIVMWENRETNMSFTGWYIPPYLRYHHKSDCGDYDYALE